MGLELSSGCVEECAAAATANSRAIFHKAIITPGKMLHLLFTLAEA